MPVMISDARINALDYLCLRVVAFGASLLKKKGFLSAAEMLAEGGTARVFLANPAKHIITEFLTLNAKNQKILQLIPSLSLFYIHYCCILSISCRVFTAENLKKI